MLGPLPVQQARLACLLFSIVRTAQCFEAFGGHEISASSTAAQSPDACLTTAAGVLASSVAREAHYKSIATRLMHFEACKLYRMADCGLLDDQAWPRDPLCLPVGAPSRQKAPGQRSSLNDSPRGRIEARSTVFLPLRLAGDGELQRNRKRYGRRQRCHYIRHHFTHYRRNGT